MDPEDSINLVVDDDGEESEMFRENGEWRDEPTWS